jgi:hypothetical protein
MQGCCELRKLGAHQSVAVAHRKEEEVKEAERNEVLDRQRQAHEAAARQRQADGAAAKKQKAQPTSAAAIVSAARPAAEPPAEASVPMHKALTLEVCWQAELRVSAGAYNRSHLLQAVHAQPQRNTRRCVSIEV